MTIQFTQEQETAIQGIVDTLHEEHDTVSFENNFKIVSGFAGTGKTTVVTHAISQAISKYNLKAKLFGTDPFDKEVYFIAPSHKAVGVLAKMLEESKTQCDEVTTVHSLLGLRIIWSAQAGKQVTTPDNRPNVVETIRDKLRNSVIFIDESSMLDEDKIKRLLFLISPTTKVFLLGDRDQLLNMDNINYFGYLCDKYKEHTYTLTEPKRNSGAIYKLAHAYRAGLYGENLPATIDECNEVHFIDYEKDLVDRFVESFLGNGNSKILCWRKKYVESWNSLIRQKLTGTSTWQVGEPVLAQSPLLDETGRKVLITNNQELTITKIVNPRQTITIQADESEHSGIGLSESFEVTTVILDNKIQAHIPYDTQVYMKQLGSLSRRRLIGILQALERKVLNVTLNYATTVHKSQGSTYTDVFIDLDDIGQVNQYYAFCRLMYVAILRARKNVYLFGDLPDKYIGD